MSGHSQTRQKRHIGSGGSGQTGELPSKEQGTQKIVQAEEMSQAENMSRQEK